LFDNQTRENPPLQDFLSCKRGLGLWEEEKKQMAG